MMDARETEDAIDEIREWTRQNIAALVRERDELLAFGRQWEKEMMSEFDPAELENDPLWQKWRSAVEGK